jgi:hypothetical protein
VPIISCITYKVNDATKWCQDVSSFYALLGHKAFNFASNSDIFWEGLNEEGKNHGFKCINGLEKKH